MKTTKVIVSWPGGLHLRPAAQLVRLAKRFRSRIVLTWGSRKAEASSIFSILLLSATLHATLDIEVVGDDESAALQAVEELFDSPEGTSRIHQGS